jgi:hypothetical protein
VGFFVGKNILSFLLNMFANIKRSITFVSTNRNKNKKMENVTSKTYRIFKGELVVLCQVGMPTVNTFGKTGLTLNKNFAFIEGKNFAKWVHVDEIEYNYSTFYWNGN